MRKLKLKTLLNAKLVKATLKKSCLQLKSSNSNLDGKLSVDYVKESSVVAADQVATTANNLGQVGAIFLKKELILVNFNMAFYEMYDNHIF